MKRVCFGVDPGIGRLGYGVVVQSGAIFRAREFGCLTTSPAKPPEQRIMQLYDELSVLVEKNAPDLFSVERLFFGNNRTTAESVFQVRGAVLLLAAKTGIPLVQPKPSEVKMAVCGNGRAEKGQVERMITRILNMDTPTGQDDAADALAIALTGLAMDNYSSLTKSGDRS
jgi:crossover junction endodeoxyribonuclease RuvC